MAEDLLNDGTYFQSTFLSSYEARPRYTQRKADDDPAVQNGALLLHRLYDITYHQLASHFVTLYHLQYLGHTKKTADHSRKQVSCILTEAVDGAGIKIDSTCDASTIPGCHDSHKLLTGHVPEPSQLSTDPNGGRRWSITVNQDSTAPNGERRRSITVNRESIEPNGDGRLSYTVNRDSTAPNGERRRSITVNRESIEPKEESRTSNTVNRDTIEQNVGRRPSITVNRDPIELNCDRRPSYTVNWDSTAPSRERRRSITVNRESTELNGARTPSSTVNQDSIEQNVGRRPSITVKRDSIKLNGDRRPSYTVNRYSTAPNGESRPSNTVNRDSSAPNGGRRGSITVNRESIELYGERRRSNTVNRDSIDPNGGRRPSITVNRDSIEPNGDRRPSYTVNGDSTAPNGGRRGSITVNWESIELNGERRPSITVNGDSIEPVEERRSITGNRDSIEPDGERRPSNTVNQDSATSFFVAAIASAAGSADYDRNNTPTSVLNRCNENYGDTLQNQNVSLNSELYEGLNDSLPRYSSSPFEGSIQEQSTFLSHSCTYSESRHSHLSRGILNTDDSGSSVSSIDVAAQLHRHSAANCDARYTWSGVLPESKKDSPVYSCKVFLGGVPWDITPGHLQHAFQEFGTVRIEFPENSTPRHGRRRPISGSPQCHGYVYAIFESDRAVEKMLQVCDRDVKEEKYFFKLSGKKDRKKVQVIPWTVNNSNYVSHASTQRLDSESTVFVGALHGMLTAEGLACVMNDLFGNVVYAGIDTDKHKYPIGSGRVTFSSHKSYMKAVNAAFVEIKSSKFTKKVQIDPYLEESLCTTCKSCAGLYFCRNMTCFKYYCERCWVRVHNSMDPSTGVHKPLSRNSKNPNLATALRNTPEIKALQVGCVQDSLSIAFQRLQS